MKSFATAFAAGLALAALAARRTPRNFRRRRQDRRAHGHVEPLCRRHRQGLARRRADGGRRLRRQGEGQAGRGDLRRPPEQARRRRQHRAQLVRQREGRRDLRRADLLGRAADLGADAREEQDQHQFRRRLVRHHRRRLLAQHGALDLRHLCALQRRRQGDGEARRGHLVLRHRRLRLRHGAGARRRQRRQGERRQGARRRPPSRSTRRTSPPSCCRRRPPRPRSWRWPMPAATPPTR